MNPWRYTEFNLLVQLQRRPLEALLPYFPSISVKFPSVCEGHADLFCFILFPCFCIVISLFDLFLFCMEFVFVEGRDGTNPISSISLILKPLALYYHMYDMSLQRLDYSCN